MRRMAAVMVMAAVTAGPGLCVAAGGAHEHGVARLDVAVEARKITFHFDSPLENLVGFERAPRTDAERSRADAAVARLKDAAGLFGIDPAAQCKLGAVELSSAALKLGTQSQPDAEGHAEIAASIEFECQNAARAGFIDVGLFDAFPRMRRIEVQAVVPKGQLKTTLKRPARRIALVR